MAIDMVQLMTTNVGKLSESKDLVTEKMRRLIDLLREFHAAVRAFGQKGWLKRARARASIARRPHRRSTISPPRRRPGRCGRTPGRSATSTSR